MMRFASRLAAAAAALVAGASTVPAAETVRFGLATNSVIVAPILLSLANADIFGQRGITLAPVFFEGKSANCIAALIAGSIDVCSVGTTTGTDAIAEGAKLRAVAAISGPINEVILSSKTVKKLGIAPDAPIDERLKAMNGLRIISAAPGSAHYTTLDKMLQSVGLGVKSLKYQVLGDTVAMQAAIRNDQVDGAMWSAGALGGLLADGTGVRWVTFSRDVPSLKDLPYNTIYATEAWAAKNADLIARLQAAYADAVARVKTQADASSQTIKAKFFPDLDAAIWRDGYAQTVPALFEGGRIPRGGWEAFLKLQAANTGKDYAPASYDRVVDKGARAE